MTPVLTDILLAFGILFCASGTWAFVRLVATARSVKALSDDLQAKLVPLVEKTEVTIDAINAELMRVDMIVTQIEDASSRVAAASSAVHAVVNAPLGAVNELGDRLRRTIAARRAKQE